MSDLEEQRATTKPMPEEERSEPPPEYEVERHQPDEQSNPIFVAIMRGAPGFGGGFLSRAAAVSSCRDHRDRVAARVREEVERELESGLVMLGLRPRGHTLLDLVATVGGALGERREEGRREGREQGYNAIVRESWDHWNERAAALLDLVLDRLAPGAVQGEEPERSATTMVDMLIDLRNNFARAAANEADAPHGWPEAVEERRRISALRRERAQKLPEGYCGSITQAARERERSAIRSAESHRADAEARADRLREQAERAVALLREAEAERDAARADGHQDGLRDAAARLDDLQRPPGSGVVTTEYQEMRRDLDFCARMLRGAAVDPNERDPLALVALGDVPVPDAVTRQVPPVTAEAAPKPARRTALGILTAGVARMLAAAHADMAGGSEHAKGRAFAYNLVLDLLERSAAPDPQKSDADRDAFEARVLAGAEPLRGLPWDRMLRRAGGPLGIVLRNIIAPAVRELVRSFEAAHTSPASPMHACNALCSGSRHYPAGEDNPAGWDKFAGDVERMTDEQLELCGLRRIGTEPPDYIAPEHEPASWEGASVIEEAIRCDRCHDLHVARERSSLSPRGPAHENPGTLWGTEGHHARRRSFTIQLCEACERTLLQWWNGEATWGPESLANAREAWRALGAALTFADTEIARARRANVADLVQLAGPLAVHVAVSPEAIDEQLAADLDSEPGQP